MKTECFDVLATASVLLVLALNPIPGHAVDGVTLIDQSKALAGNVTSGDAAGFPVTITRPGAFRLSSNLVVPMPGTVIAGQCPTGLPGFDPPQPIGILVRADNVTIDLNGFSIIGPNFPDTRCGGTGIFDANAPVQRTAVRNGIVEGFRNGIVISAGWDSRSTIVQDVRVATVKDNLGRGGGGIIVGPFSLLKNNIVMPGVLDAVCPSVVVENFSEPSSSSSTVGAPCAKSNNATAPPQ